MSWVCLQSAVALFPGHTYHFNVGYDFWYYVKEIQLFYLSFSSSFSRSVSFSFYVAFVPARNVRLKK